MTRTYQRRDFKQTLTVRVTPEDRYRWLCQANIESLTLQQWTIKALNAYCDSLRDLDDGGGRASCATTDILPSSSMTVNPLIQQGIERHQDLMRGTLTLRSNGHPRGCGCGDCAVGGGGGAPPCR